MRVLIVYPKMELYGGAELLVVRLANYLSRERVYNALLTTNIFPEVEMDLTGTDIIKCPYRPIKGVFKPVNLFRTLFLLHKEVGKNLGHFDVINVHNYPAELSVFRYQKPAVWMCNEPPQVHVEFDREPKYTPRWLSIRTLLAFEKHVVRKHLRHVVVADQFNANRFRDIYGFSPHIINYGIDYNYFADLPTREHRKSPPHPFTVLQVGMLTPLKNQIESIRTIDKLRKVIPDIKLILAGYGEGEYFLSLKEFIRSRRLQNNVYFEGHVSRGRLRELYHTSDVLLHPIRSQGGWLSPFEAVASGLPIVVSKEMTASELIKQESLGTVTDDFVGAVLDIHTNRSEYEKMAIQRAEWVRDNLSWDNFCEKMLAVFFAAMDDHAPDI